MNKVEFLAKLERSLSGTMSVEEIRDYVNYYDNYISSQVRNGKGEHEIIQQLGEPRLIAKSIIDAMNRTGGVTYSNIEDADYEKQASGKFKIWLAEFLQKALVVASKMPGWLWMIILGTVLILVLAIATSILSLILPILLPVLCIVLVIQVFRNNKF